MRRSGTRDNIGNSLINEIRSLILMFVYINPSFTQQALIIHSCHKPIEIYTQTDTHN